MRPSRRVSHALCLFSRHTSASSWNSDRKLSASFENGNGFSGAVHGWAYVMGFSLRNTISVASHYTASYWKMFHETL